MPLTRIKSRSIANTESFTFGAATVTGNLTVSSSTNLGSVSNVKITGGVADYVLRTDGAGNLSWVAQTGGGGGGTDQYARDTANAAFVQANAAFNAANTGGGGGGGGSFISIVVDDFVANGNTTTFTLSATPLNENYTSVSVDGVVQQRDTYTVSGNVITFDSTFEANANIEVTTTISGQEFDYLGYLNRTYTGDNTTTTFAVTSGVTSNSIIVTENGVLQTPIIDYSVNGANVIFTTAPATSVTIGIRELAPAGNTGGGGGGGASDAKVVGYSLVFGG